MRSLIYFCANRAIANWLWMCFPFHNKWIRSSNPTIKIDVNTFLWNAIRIIIVKKKIANFFFLRRACSICPGWKYYFRKLRHTPHENNMARISDWHFLFLRQDWIGGVEPQTMQIQFSICYQMHIAKISFWLWTFCTTSGLPHIYRFYSDFYYSLSLSFLCRIIQILFV